MPKTRQQKEEILSKTVERLETAQSVVLVNVQGVKVNEIEEIRDALFPQNVKFQVAKNSLLKLALEQVKMEIPAELADQPLGMAFSLDDAVAGAKSMQAFTKEFEALEVVGGLMEGRFLSASQVNQLASLPSREQLLGQLVGTLQAPISGFVRVLGGNLQGLVSVLSQIKGSEA